MSEKRSECAWCQFDDDCGQPYPCPVAAIEDGREPTMRDVIALLTAIQTGINQRFAQVLLLIERHLHKPGGRP